MTFLRALVVLSAAQAVMGTACTHVDIDMTSETDAWLVPEDCTELTLAGRGIDDAGVAKLAISLVTDRSRNVVTRLTKLELWNNRIGVAGGKALAGALAGNDVLRELHLNGNHLSDDGCIAIAKALGKNKALRRLGLAMNKVGIAGANAIAVALSQNNQLSYLELGKNDIGDAGASAIAPALTGNSGLTTMWLGGNSIGNHGARALAAGLADNHHMLHLMFEDNPIDDNKAHLEIENVLTRNRRGVLPPDADDGEAARVEL